MDFEIDLGSVVKALRSLRAGARSDVCGRRYSLTVRRTHPPNVCRTTMNSAGLVEVIMPKPGLLKVVMSLIAAGIGVAWAFAGLRSGTPLAILFGVGVLSWTAWHAISTIYHATCDMCWSAVPGKLSERILYAGHVFQEKTYGNVEKLELENGIWVTGTGSSNKLQAWYRSEAGLLTRLTLGTLEGPYAEGESHQPPSVGPELLEAAEYLASQCEVPLEALVTSVPDPRTD